MRIAQIALQRWNIDIIRNDSFVKNLIVDDSQKSRRMHMIRLADLLYRQFSHTHLQAKPTDDLNGILLVRYKVAHLMRSFIHKV